jgi:hypothetical protein
MILEAGAAQLPWETVYSKSYVPTAAQEPGAELDIIEGSEESEHPAHHVTNASSEMISFTRSRCRHDEHRRPAQIVNEQALTPRMVTSTMAPQKMTSCVIATMPMALCPFYELFRAVGIASWNGGAMNWERVESNEPTEQRHRRMAP